MKITVNAEKAKVIDAVEAPRDLMAEIDALKAALAKKNLISEADITGQKDAKEIP